MSVHKYTAGLNNVGSYQVSGMPFATGSLTIPASGSTPLRIEFPYVTQWVSVINTDSKHVRLGFSENGVKNGGNNYVLIHGAWDSSGFPILDADVLQTEQYI